MPLKATVAIARTSPATCPKCDGDGYLVLERARGGLRVVVCELCDTLGEVSPETFATFRAAHPNVRP